MDEKKLMDAPEQKESYSGKPGDANVVAKTLEGVNAALEHLINSKNDITALVVAATSQDGTYVATVGAMSHLLVCAREIGGSVEALLQETLEREAGSKIATRQDLN